MKSDKIFLTFSDHREIYILWQTSIKEIHQFIMEFLVRNMIKMTGYFPSIGKEVYLGPPLMDNNVKLPTTINHVHVKQFHH